MSLYALNNDLGGTKQAISTSYKSLVTVRADGTVPKRGRIVDLFVGTLGTPADNVIQFDVSRITADGTGTAQAPLALDPADPAAVNDGGLNYTAEPTVTATSSLFNLGMNVRASYRWVAAPGSELIHPATANNGFAVRAKATSYTGTASAGIIYDQG